MRTPVSDAMKYFHRTHQAPATVLAQSATFFGGRLAPTEETPAAAGSAAPSGT